MILSLLISLFLTIVIELTLSLIMGIRDKGDIKVVILVNICTNPIVVYIANCLMLFTNNFIYNIGVAILEILAIIVEFILYKKYLKFDKISPFAISFFNNVMSFSIGLIINYLFLLS